MISRKLVAGIFAIVIACLVALPFVALGNATSIETGGTQVLPRLTLNGGSALTSVPTIGLQDNNSLIWSPTGTTSGTYLKCNSTTSICTFNASYVEVSAGSNTVYFDGMIAQAGGGRVNARNTQAGIDTYFSNNTGATGRAVVIGSTTADGTSGVSAVTLLEIQTGIFGTPVTKIAVNGVGTLTSSVATGNNAIALSTNGARIDLGTGASDHFLSDGTTISTPANLSVNAILGQNNNSVVLQAQNTNAGISVTGALLFGVGTAGSAANQSAIGTFSKNITVVGSGADTTEDNLMTSALPASAMNVDGRGIRVTAWGDGVSTADVTTVKCYFGATAVVTKVLTASQANTWRAVFEVLRTGAATQTASGVIENGGTANSTAQTNAAPTETLSNSITVKCTGQRTVSSVANSVRQLAMIVEVMN